MTNVQDRRPKTEDFNSAASFESPVEVQNVCADCPLDVCASPADICIEDTSSAETFLIDVCQESPAEILIEDATECDLELCDESSIELIDQNASTPECHDFKDDHSYCESSNPAFAQLQSRYIFLQKAFEKRKVKLKKKERQERKARLYLSRAKARNITNFSSLQRRFRHDQIRALTSNSTRGVKWTTASIKEGLVFKMKMGSKVFQDLVQTYPIFPSARTLQKQVQHCRFDSGILNEVFDMLECDFPKWKENEKDFVVVLDEMAIEEAEVYDHSLKKVLGKCTFPTHTGKAKRILVFLLAGCTVRLKVTVAYFFTASRKAEERKNKTNETGEAMKSIVLQLVNKTETIGGKVHCIIGEHIGQTSLPQ